jgi:hypothetical protein
MRIRNVESKREFESAVDEYITRGYSVKSLGEDTAKLKDAQYGGIIAHLVIFVLFGWWTLFVANVLYAAFSYSRGDEVLVKMRGEGN